MYWKKNIDILTSFDKGAKVYFKLPSYINKIKKVYVFINNPVYSCSGSGTIGNITFPILFTTINFFGKKIYDLALKMIDLTNFIIDTHTYIYTNKVRNFALEVNQANLKNEYLEIVLKKTDYFEQYKESGCLPEDYEPKITVIFDYE